MRSQLQLGLGLGLTLLLAGCSLADKALLDALADSGVGTDGGVTDPGASDRCNDTGIRVISTSEADIEINTTTLSNSVGSLAGCGLSTPGNDGFLAVDVQAGEYWHFHLRVDPVNDPDPSARNPVLYLLDSSCSGTTCSRTQLADFCSASQDEHFGITFETAGVFRIGIDDVNAGGGAYLLDAIRPLCDGTPEHGEACDGGARCSANCLRILSSDSVQETGFNFNFFEANLVSLVGTGGALTINGDIGGFEGCAYPDVYAIDVPINATLNVKSEQGGSTDCVPSGLLGLELRDAAGNDQGSVSTVDGCQEISRVFPSAGRAFVVLRDLRVSATQPLPYKLEFEVELP